MNKDIIKTFNLTTAIIGLLSIISLFILRDNIICLNKKDENKDENKDKKKLLGGNNVYKTSYFWFTFSKIFGVCYALSIYIILFTTILDFWADNIYLGIFLVCPIIAAFFSVIITTGVTMITDKVDIYVNIVTNFIISIGLVILTIDRLLISSYSMGCLIENSNFTAIMNSTTNTEINKLWNDKTVTFKPNTNSPKAGPEEGPEEGSEPDPQNVKELEYKLFQKNYVGTSPMWHSKCDAEEEDIISKGDIRDKAYCYTAEDLNNMKNKWAEGAENQTQSIFNTCMGMYYRQHSLSLGAITNPTFVGRSCAAQKAFFINCLVFSGSLGYLILADKEAGLKKLGSLIALDSHKAAFDKLDD